jgi:DNA-binding XRE family transcriptional regulator
VAYGQIGSMNRDELRARCKNIGAKIKAARQSLDMTQQDVANSLDLTKQSVSHHENGLGTPTVGNLMQYSELLGLTMADIFAEE